jgi:hypothetical protein
MGTFSYYTFSVVTGVQGLILDDNLEVFCFTKRDSLCKSLVGRLFNGGIHLV